MLKRLQQFDGVTFESSSGRTPQFAAFASAYRANLAEALKGTDFEMVSWSVGHFYCTAFIQNRVTFKLAYLYFSDVRFFPGEWLNHVLVRSAKSTRDYTGGQNRYTHLSGLVNLLQEVTK